MKIHVVQNHSHFMLFGLCLWFILVVEILFISCCNVKCEGKFMVFLVA